MRRFIVFFFIFFIVSSCSDIDDLAYYPKSQDDLEVEHSCSQMNKVTNLLEYESFQWAMKCWGWDSDYPHFYSAFRKIDSDSWNHLLAPIDEFFFNHLVRRNKFLNLFDILDRGENLDDLVNLINVFIEGNLHDLVYKISSDVIRVDPQRFNKDTLFQVMEILNLRKDTILLFKDVYDAMIRAFDTNIKNSVVELSKLKVGENFSLEIVDIVDDLFLSLEKEKFVDLDRYLINNFFENKDELGNYWFHQWMKNLGPEITPLRILLSQGHHVNSNLPSNFNHMLELTPSFICPGGKKSNNNYTVNMDNFFRKSLDKFVKKDHHDFISFVNSELSNLHLLTLICNPGIQFIDKNVNIGSLVENFLQLLKNKESYLLLQKIHQVMLEAGDYIGEIEPYYFIRLYLSNFYQSIAKFHSHLEARSGNQYLKILFNIGSSYSKDDYENFINLVKRVISKEGIAVLENIGKIWLNLDMEEKKNLIHRFHIVFERVLNSESVLRFLGEIVRDLDQFLPFLSKDIIGNDNLKSKTIWSFHELSKELRSFEVVRDMKKIFSYREVIRIIRTIARAVSNRDKITYFQGINLDHKKELPYTIIDGSLNIWSKDDIRCMEYLVEENKDFQNFVLDLPESCRASKAQYFPVKLLTYINEIKINDNDSGDPSPSEDGEGMVGVNVIGDLFSQLLLLKNDESYISLASTLNFARDILVDKNVGVKDLENFLQLVQFFSKDNDPIYKNYHSFLIDKFSSLEDREVAQYVGIFSKILKYYSLSSETRKTFVEKNSCLNTYPLSYRIPSCPDRKLVKDNIVKIFKILKRKFSKKKSLLEVLVEAITPGHGIKIPFWTKEDGQHYIDYVFTLENYLAYFYDSFTHGNTVRFYTGPNKDVDYFDSEMRLATQMDITTRDSSFHGGFYGLMYFNSTSLAWNYLDKAKRVLGIFRDLSRCLNSSFCQGKLLPVLKYTTFGYFNYSVLPHEASFWSLNVANTSSSLMFDEDKYKHNGKFFDHNIFLKSFLNIAVQSSSDDVLYTSVFNKISKEYIKNHNGEIVFLLTDLSILQNMARFVYDRFGQSKYEFDAILRSDDLQRVNRNLLKGIKVKETQDVLLNIINKHTGSSKKALTSLTNSLVDWLYDMPYDQQRIVEEVMGGIAVIISSIGSDDSDPLFKQFGNTYESNNIAKHIDSLENMILIIDRLFKNLPDKSQLFTFFDTIHDAVQFVKKGLSVERLSYDKDESSVWERRRAFYIWLNESFKIFDVLMNKKEEVNFFDLLQSKIQQSPQKTMDILREVGGMFRPSSPGGEGRGEKDRVKIDYMAEWLSYYSKHPKWRTKNIRRWLLSPAILRLIDYFLRLSPDNPNETNLSVILNRLFRDDYDAFSTYMKEISEVLEQ